VGRTSSTCRYHLRSSDLFAIVDRRPARDGSRTHLGYLSSIQRDRLTTRVRVKSNFVFPIRQEGLECLWVGRRVQFWAPHLLCCGRWGKSAVGGCFTNYPSQPIALSTAHTVIACRCPCWSHMLASARTEQGVALASLSMLPSAISTASAPGLYLFGLVTFASLPDGTNYAAESVLDATGKKIQVKVTNSGRLDSDLV